MDGRNQFYLGFFSIDVIINFFTEHISTTTHKPERRLKKLAVAYIQGQFFLDAIALLPLEWFARTQLRMPPRWARLFLLLKLVRLIVGFKLLNYKVFMKQIKRILEARLQRRIE
mmetsp:Transcript_31133/g.47591  ORF Transcript_31133/g.47591 Transcript_31133/m.47591 type:complete len:114 (+) Transcript_31133:680-1021(+)